MKNKKIILRILNVLFFLFVAFLTFYAIFKKNDIPLILKNLKEVKIIFIILAIFCMITYLFLDGLNVRRILNTFNHKVSLLNSFKYAAIGFFFSAITPSATGGNPAQLYFMKKDKICVSHSALALLVNLSSFQFIVGLIAFIGFLFNFDLIMNYTGKFKYLVIFGILINISFLILLLIMIFSKKLAMNLYKFVVKILKKFHYKKTEKFETKAEKQINEYHECSKYLKKNKKILIKIILTTIISLIAYHSIPYCIYLSFGLHSANIIKFILLGMVSYAAVAFLPLPGAMGASEGSFMIIFKIFFPKVLLSSAMLISRGISYYLFVLISGLMILGILAIYKIKKQTK